MDAFDMLHIRLGYACWRRALDVFGWRGNIFNGYRFYTHAFADLAQGKFYTEPANADRPLQLMCDMKIISPCKFMPWPQRRIALQLHPYKVATDAPVAGHYLDWDFKVEFDVDKVVQSLPTQRQQDVTMYEKLASRLVTGSESNQSDMSSFVMHTLQPAVKIRDELEVAIDEMIEKMPDDEMIQLLMSDFKLLDKAITCAESTLGGDVIECIRREHGRRLENAQQVRQQVADRRKARLAGTRMLDLASMD